MSKTSCLDCEQALDFGKDHVVRIVVSSASKDRPGEYVHEECVSLKGASCEKHGEFFQTKKGIGVCPSC